MRYLEDVLTLRLDSARCNGCGLCVKVCPHAVFAIQDKRAALVDRGACMECGACARNCSQGAVQVRAGVGCAAGILAGLRVGGPPSCGQGQADCGCAKGPSGCC